MSAPAWVNRQESFPSWSISNWWPSCLMMARRTPRDLISRMSFSSSVVLPEPEYPASAIMGMFVISPSDLVHAAPGVAAFRG